jgi:hypothetical protein
MAQPKSSIVDIWFYVNPETEVIDGVYCFSLLGITKRQDKEWVPVTREESGINDLSGDDVYQFDWESDDTVMTEDFDFDSYDENTPDPVKLYDEGSLTLEELQNTSDLIMSGFSEVDELPNE